MGFVALDLLARLKVPLLSLAVNFFRPYIRCSDVHLGSAKHVLQHDSLLKDGVFCASCVMFLFFKRPVYNCVCIPEKHYWIEFLPSCTICI